MIRLMLAVFTTVLVVLFSMANTHHVALSFVFGSPVKVRMIFLLLTAFGVGMVFTGFIQMGWRLSRRRHLRQQQKELVVASGPGE